ncbi:MAG: cysteine--tRNA ligase [Ignavibacteria bacterium]|nr:cysteine--tRNA ligase [Ignavibacteria bacterium]
MLKLFNTLSRSKEEFIPVSPGKTGMYSCGPTVYDYQHIGNFRTFFFEDILLRVLKYNGYEVKYVMNITDVGHLVSDQDEGEDKMEKSAKHLGKSVWELSEYYTGVFFRDRDLLNIFPPDIYTKATDYIKEQIDMVKCLEEKGFTYKTSDGIYFDTSLLKDYGKLAKLDIGGLKEGARIEFSAEKKNITDFALWKLSPENEKRQMEWESPWGMGFPGWHIECSAMSKAILGKHFDIHCGGVDHIPIHHTNEIAQSEACNGEKFVNYWLHGEFLDMGNEKMSKSTGRFITLQTLIDKGYSPLDYRFFLLTAHYRRKQKFTFEALDAAKNGYNNLKSRVLNMKTTGGELRDASAQIISDYKKSFKEKINDDLNMPEAMAVLWEAVKDNSLNDGEKLHLIYDFDKVFGLGLESFNFNEGNTEIPDEIKKLAEIRTEAKSQKDFKKADEIRQLVKQKGYDISDSKDGFTIKKI